jgi:polysaccharide export outer membrane protein
MAVLAMGQPAQPTSETYKIQPEDLLRIQLYNEQQVAADVPVGRDGAISAPFVGMVKVAGKTTAEVEAELTKLYQDKLRLRDPRVAVVIIRYRILRASVGGFVNRPGNYEIRPGDTLLSLLNQGGGVSQLGDARRATFRRSGSLERIPIDLYAMITLGDTSQNYEVQDGDELVVPEETKGRVTILGQVQRPGPFQWREGLTLAEVIALAGGEIPTRTMFSKTMIMRSPPGRPGQIIRIEANFVRYIRNGDSTQNLVLQPGDLIYVPETKTPDLNRLSTQLNSLFFLDRFLNQGIFGLRLGRF